MPRTMDFHDFKPWEYADSIGVPVECLFKKMQLIGQLWGKTMDYIYNIYIIYTYIILQKEDGTM